MTWCPSEQASAELRCEGKSLQATENERMSLEYLKRKGGQHSSQSRRAVQNGGWRGRGQPGWSWGSSLSTVGSSLTARQFFTRDTVSVGTLASYFLWFLLKYHLLREALPGHPIKRQHPNSIQPPPFSIPSHCLLLLQGP